MNPVKHEKKSASEIPVIVTTEHRGVFFGYMNPKSVNDEQIELRRSRLCVYWSADVKGFMGLASGGPTKSCRIGPQVKSITLRKITAVLAVEEKAVVAWEAAPWN